MPVIVEGKDRAGAAMALVIEDQRTNGNAPVPLLIVTMPDGKVHGFEDADDARRWLEENVKWSHAVWVQEWVWHPRGAGAGGDAAGGRED